jgi:uroporphyrinogen-III synthase
VSWVERLVARGVDAVAVPLIEIGPPAEPRAVSEAWAGLSDRDLVVFVSVNAVERFFAARPADASWPGGLHAAAPGPGTGASLQKEGVPAAEIVAPAADAAQLDSESLWQALRETDWNGRSVLVVRGDGGRDWLIDRFVEAGATVEAVAAYRRLPPWLSSEERRRVAAAFAAPAAHAWLFSSSEAIGHLAALDGFAIGPGSRALATHPRIAARARQAGFTEVFEVRPDLDAVVACIQSMQP